MRLPHRSAFALLSLVLVLPGTVRGQAQEAIVLAEFVFDEVPFPQCHASTLADTDGGLVVAWFGGTREKHEDVGIWVARREGERWSAPREVANGIQSASLRYPCWNPVLFQEPAGPLRLFYKVGPSPSTWWGMAMESQDGGGTWSAARRLPDGILGPVKNKPIRLDDGRLLCGSSTEHAGWRVHMETTSDGGRTWSHTEPLNDGKSFGAIQPTILRLGGSQIQILCRSRGPGRILSATSADGGRTWSSLTETELPNPNSGIDAVTLRDGRHLLVYNHTARGRSPLNVAVSEDGQSWQAAAVLESDPGEYSYPAVIQSHDGRIHMTYTWRRERIKHVVLDLDRLVLKPITDGRWPD